MGLRSIDQKWLKTHTNSEKFESQFCCVTIFVICWVQWPGGNVWVSSLEIEGDAKKKSKISHHFTCDILISIANVWDLMTQFFTYYLMDRNHRNQAIFHEPSLLRSPLSFPLKSRTISFLFCSSRYSSKLKYTWNLEIFSFKIFFLSLLIL